MKFFLDENFSRTALGFFRRLADALAQLGQRDLNDTVWLVTETRIRSRHAGN